MTAKDDRDAKDQFNVYLRTELIREIKHAAIDSGQKLGEFVEHVFEDYLRRQRGERKAER